MTFLRWTHLRKSLLLPQRTRDIQQTKPNHRLVLRSKPLQLWDGLLKILKFLNSDVASESVVRICSHWINVAVPFGTAWVDTKLNQGSYRELIIYWSLCLTRRSPGTSWAAWRSNTTTWRTRSRSWRPSRLIWQSSTRSRRSCSAGYSIKIDQRSSSIHFRIVV